MKNKNFLYIIAQINPINAVFIKEYKMKDKIKFFLAAFISIMPLNILRVTLYKTIFGYKIKNSKIGFGTIINIEDCEVNNAFIGKLNLFTGPFGLKIGANSAIGFGNTFRCGKWTTNKEFEAMNFKRTFELGESVSIDNKHYFDISGLIKIGDKTFISGNSSQFWTHGGDKKDNDIIIGKNCYIGTAVKFSPGSLIADDSIVAMGSIISKKYKKPNSLISPPAMRVLQFPEGANPLFNR